MPQGDTPYLIRTYAPRSQDQDEKRSFCGPERIILALKRSSQRGGGGPRKTSPASTGHRQAAKSYSSVIQAQPAIPFVHRPMSRRLVLREPGPVRWQRCRFRFCCPLQHMI
jgi:hypothetical protein